MYRYIRLREYIDPPRMYPGTSIIILGGFHQQMNQREAKLILGVHGALNAYEIKKRHKTLMMNNHPDNGGSTYMATKINEAKNLLLQ